MCSTQWVVFQKRLKHCCINQHLTSSFVSWSWSSLTAASCSRPETHFILCSTLPGPQPPLLICLSTDLKNIILDRRTLFFHAVLLCKQTRWIPTVKLKKEKTHFLTALTSTAATEHSLRGTLSDSLMWSLVLSSGPAVYLQINYKVC